jgi:hypothetical protein
MNTSQKVEHFLLHVRNFEKGKALYNSIPGRNLSYARALSMQAESKTNFEVLCYELGLVAGFNEIRVKGLLAKASKKQTDVDNKPKYASIRERVLSMDYHKELRPQVSELDLETEDHTKETLQEALIAHWEAEALKDKPGDKAKEEKKSL